MIDWTRQVVTLVQNDAFFPHPIRRELKSILELFTRKNLGKIKYKGRRIKLDKILPWFADYMGKWGLHYFRQHHDKHHLIIDIAMYFLSSAISQATQVQNSTASFI